MPEIIKLGLKHGDPKRREYSIQILQRITGHSFDLPENATTGQKAAAIDAWLKWWEEEGKKPAPKSE